MIARIGLACLLVCSTLRAAALEPIPDKLVVLTFDDATRSQFENVRPLLLRYGFGATFFISEGFDFSENKKDYMTWDEVAQLDRDGFEVGNHTRDHPALSDENLDQLPEQLETINQRCRAHGIPVPVSFAYPGNAISPRALEQLRARGILFARRGGMPEHPYEQGRGFAYEPGLDDPLLIPSAGDARPSWELNDFERAVNQARHGRIAVLQFHGVPDAAHPWVNTPLEKFARYMDFLRANDFRVIAMRDLQRYVDPEVRPKDPQGVVEDRKQTLAAGQSRDDFREPTDERELKYWLGNMAAHHGFTAAEIGAATGLPPESIRAALDKFGLPSAPTDQTTADGSLKVLPYPGGRHPRIGFLDGAIRPQRETKVSVFAPWEDGGYVVVDVPEAIWVQDSAGRQLLYLAHTHVPTMWTRQGVSLDRLEWTRHRDGSLAMERELPNRVTFGTRVHGRRRAVLMEMWLTNGTDQKLTGLRVQNCVMLKAARGFAALSSEDKVLSTPFVACPDESGRRWIITAWEPCLRPWANADCPCMHSDPQFPDCDPGETQRLQGWLSFYEGKDIHAELKRIDREWKRGSE